MAFISNPFASSDIPEEAVAARVGSIYSTADGWRFWIDFYRESTKGDAQVFKSTLVRRPSATRIAFAHERVANVLTDSLPGMNAL